MQNEIVAQIKHNEPPIREWENECAIDPELCHKLLHFLPFQSLMGFGTQRENDEKRCGKQAAFPIKKTHKNLLEVET